LFQNLNKLHVQKNSVL